MIDNNHELTIGELDCVSGSLGGMSGVSGGNSVMELISTILRNLNNPVLPAPPENGPNQQFQQLMNGLGVNGQG